jgi:hypothetical protein
MSSSYRDSLNKWLAEQEVTAHTVYDVGGSQEQISKRVKSWEVDDYLIFDLPQPHKGRQPDVAFDINEHSPALEGYKGVADIVYCLEVFEYVYNPIQAIKNLACLVGASGRIFASFPFYYPVHQPIEQDYLRYTLAGVKKYAELAGLRIVNVTQRKPISYGLLHFNSVERLRGAKEYDHNTLGYIVEFSK